MHIQSCERPKRIWNDYIKEFMFVPCGKCNTCNVRKSSQWVNRLKRESSCHRYTAFATLTYNEVFCPYVQFSNLDDDISLFRQDCFRTEFKYSSDDICNFDSRSYSLVFAENGKVRVLNYKDFQNFVKRLRITIQRTYEKEFQTKEGVPCLRYFCCGEYGPTTYRPHYHVLFWFDSEWLAERFDYLLFSCWQESGRPLGLIQWSYVKNDASSYVAQYVNSYSHLPSMLTFPEIRPFGRGSRRPPIGTLFQSSETIRKIFDEGIIQLSIPQKEGKASLNVPLFPSLKNRLFPKCPIYSKVNPSDRITCYTISRRFPKREEYEKEDYWLADLKDILHDYALYENPSSFLYHYLDDITFGFSDVRPLLHALSVSQRVLAQSDIFGVSVHYYVSRIDNYYNNVEQQTLKDWFSFAEEYSKTNNCNDLIYSDLEMVQKAYDNLSSINSLMLDSYDLHTFAHDLSRIGYDHVKDYQDMKSLSCKIVKETSKTKKKNDYLNAHPELYFFTHL